MQTNDLISPIDSNLDCGQAVKPFSLDRVRLLDSLFYKAMMRNAEYLLDLDADRLLCNYRIVAGLEPKGEVYEGWESATIAGHTLGHYLSALAYHFAATSDVRFQDRINLILAELKECQDKRGDGYTSGILESERLWAEIANRDIRSQGFDLNGIWVPWYNLHKLFAGLIDIYQCCGTQLALEILIKLSDWSIEATKNLDEADWQKMLACEHGGMNESLAQVYALTGDRKYLEHARQFYHEAVLEPLSRKEDSLPGLHGNTQIPKIIGLAEIYDATGDEKLRVTCEHFWRSVVEDHTYAIGGHSSGEYFGPSRKLAQRLTMTTAETCNTYNMLKLTKRLFAWEPKIEYADYYEQAMINHILASQDTKSAMMCYFVSLHPGHFKTFSTPYDAFWCCVGTGIENHTRYGEAVYFYEGDDLYLNLFVASELDWSEKGIKIRMETEYPVNSRVKLTLQANHPSAFNLKLRCPSWLDQAVIVKVNGEEFKGQPGSYLNINRLWKDGDKVEFDFPYSLRTIPMPDEENRVAIAYGPVVLAGLLGSDHIEEPAPYANDNHLFFGIPAPEVPVLVTNGRPVAEWLVPVPGADLRFKTNQVGRPHDVELGPFYEIAHERYTVYWDLFDDEGWLKREEQYRADQKHQEDLRQRTIDAVQFGEMQPERDHEVEGEKSHPEAVAGDKMRIAWHGGWFSCKLRSGTTDPVDLVVQYWGQDGRNRDFEVLVNGDIVGHETFTVAQHNTYFESIYALTAEQASQPSLSVRFQSANGRIVGPVCGCRIVKRTS